MHCRPLLLERQNMCIFRICLQHDPGQILLEESRVQWLGVAFNTAGGSVSLPESPGGSMLLSVSPCASAYTSPNLRIHLPMSPCASLYLSMCPCGCVCRFWMLPTVLVAGAVKASGSNPVWFPARGYGGHQHYPAPRHIRMENTIQHKLLSTMI